MPRQYRKPPIDHNDPDYKKIAKAFNLDPGNPLPRLKKHGSKPFAMKRVYRRARR